MANTNGFIKMAVGAIVVILVAVGVVLPLFATAGATEATLTNEGLWRMKEIENGDVWTKNTGVAWAYGDTDLEIPTSAGGSNVILGENWCVRANGQVRSDATVNISTNLGTATATAGEEFVIVEKTDTVSWSRNFSYPGYGACINGGYIMTDYNNPGSYVNADTEIFGTGASTVDNVGVFVHVVGSVEDGATFTIGGAAGGTTISDVVISDATVTYTEETDYIDLYSVTSMSCTVSFNTLDENNETVAHSGDVVFSSYVVPYEVTAELAEHPDGVTLTIIQILPVIILVAVLMMVVGTFVSNRRA